MKGNTKIHNIKAIFKNNPDKSFCYHQIYQIIEETQPTKPSAVSGFLTYLQKRGFLRVLKHAKCDTSDKTHTHFQYKGQNHGVRGKYKTHKHRDVKEIVSKTLYLCPYCKKEIKV